MALRLVCATPTFSTLFSVYHLTHKKERMSSRAREAAVRFGMSAYPSDSDPDPTAPDSDIGERPAAPARGATSQRPAGAGYESDVLSDSFFGDPGGADAESHSSVMRGIADGIDARIAQNAREPEQEPRVFLTPASVVSSTNRGSAVAEIGAYKENDPFDTPDDTYVAFTDTEEEILVMEEEEEEEEDITKRSMGDGDTPQKKRRSNDSSHGAGAGAGAVDSDVEEEGSCTVPEKKKKGHFVTRKVKKEVRRRVSLVPERCWLCEIASSPSQFSRDAETHWRLKSNSDDISRAKIVKRVINVVIIPRFFKSYGVRPRHMSSRQVYHHFRYHHGDRNSVQHDILATQIDMRRVMLARVVSMSSEEFTKASSPGGWTHSDFSGSATNVLHFDHKMLAAVVQMDKTIQGTIASMDKRDDDAQKKRDGARGRRGQKG